MIRNWTNSSLNSIFWYTCSIFGFKIRKTPAEEFQTKLRFFKEIFYLDEIKDSQSPDVNDTPRRLRAPKKIDEAADDFLLKYLKNEI